VNSNEEIKQSNVISQNLQFVPHLLMRGVRIFFQDHAHKIRFPLCQKEPKLLKIPNLHHGLYHDMHHGPYHGMHHGPNLNLAKNIRDLGISLLIVQIEELLLLLNGMQEEKKIKRRNKKRTKKENQRMNRRK